MRNGIPTFREFHAAAMAAHECDEQNLPYTVFGTTCDALEDLANEAGIRKSWMKLYERLNLYVKKKIETAQKKGKKGTK